MSQKRVARIEERAAYTKYLILPTAYPFTKLVRIYAVVFSFISKCMRGREVLSRLLAEGRVLFRSFSINLEEQSSAEDEPDSMLATFAMVVTPENTQVNGASLVSTFNRDLFQSQQSREKFSDTPVATEDRATVHTDNYLNMAMLYLFRKATEELKGFHSAEALKKIGHEVDGVILSRGRIMQGMEFMETAEIKVDLGSLGIRTSLPVLHRHSPPSYSIVQQMHWSLAPHRGVETCNRVSLENVSIIQGAGLYREIGENCPRCTIKRERYLEAAFGPTRESQLTIAPPSTSRSWTYLVL